MKVRVGKRRSHLIQSITIGDRVVAQNGSLMARREDRSEPGLQRDVELRGGIDKVTLEQSGPVRAVLKLEGRHVEAGTGGRVWLPFTVRLHFFAGSGAIRLTHSFVFDGDGNQDFNKASACRSKSPSARNRNSILRIMCRTRTAPPGSSDRIVRPRRDRRISRRAPPLGIENPPRALASNGWAMRSTGRRKGNAAVIKPGAADSMETCEPWLRISSRRAEFPAVTST